MLLLKSALLIDGNDWESAFDKRGVDWPAPYLWSDQHFSLLKQHYWDTEVYIKRTLPLVLVSFHITIKILPETR